MKFVYSVGYCWLLVLLVSCNNSKQDNKRFLKKTGSSAILQNNTDTAFENYIVDTIFSLKEIQKENRRLDSLSNHVKGIAMMVNKAIDNKGEYEITVGYNGADRFETYHIFYFDSLTKQITILDPASGAKISLDKWRAKKL